MPLPAFYPIEQALALLPAQPGSYILRLQLESAARLQIGCLGEFELPAGNYVYCGSAFGPGGIRARVQRHTRNTGKIHWHIDALRRPARLEAAAWQVGVRAECAWSRELAGLPGSKIPVFHFGASDCRAHCPAHLVWVNSGPNSLIHMTKYGV